MANGGYISLTGVVALADYDISSPGIVTRKGAQNIARPPRSSTYSRCSLRLTTVSVAGAKIASLSRLPSPQATTLSRQCYKLLKDIYRQPRLAIPTCRCQSAAFLLVRRIRYWPTLFPTRRRITADLTPTAFPPPQAPKVGLAQH